MTKIKKKQNYLTQVSERGQTGEQKSNILEGLYNKLAG